MLFRSAGGELEREKWGRRKSEKVHKASQRHPSCLSRGSARRCWLPLRESERTKNAAMISASRYYRRTRLCQISWRSQVHTYSPFNLEGANTSKELSKLRPSWYSCRMRSTRVSSRHVHGRIFKLRLDLRPYTTCAVARLRHRCSFQAPSSSLLQIRSRCSLQPAFCVTSRDVSCKL